MSNRNPNIDKLLRMKLRAHTIVSQSFWEGSRRRSKRCELCNKIPNKTADGRLAIVGRHWKGYAYPLRVWWVCRSCNGILRKDHSGELTKAQARKKVFGVLKKRQGNPIYSVIPT